MQLGAVGSDSCQKRVFEPIFARIGLRRLDRMANHFVERDSRLSSEDATSMAHFASTARYLASVAAAKKAHGDRQQDINRRHQQSVNSLQAAYDQAIRTIPEDSTATRRFATAIMEANAMKDAATRKSAELHDSDIFRAQREFQESSDGR
jgi:hypothetical protein